MAGFGSHPTLDDGAEQGEKAQHDTGSVAQPKTPAVAPDSTGTAATTVQDDAAKAHAFVAQVRLSAAAPALYVALRRMLEAFEGWGETTSPACQQARAAIAKAEGR